MDEFRRFKADRDCYANRVRATYVGRATSGSGYLQISHPRDLAFKCKDSIVSLGACIANEIQSIRYDGYGILDLDRYDDILFCTSARMDFYRFNRDVRSNLRIYFFSFRDGFRIKDRQVNIRYECRSSLQNGHQINSSIVEALFSGHGGANFRRDNFRDVDVR